MNTVATPPSFDITPVTIEEEMKRSYLDYAMSVIVSRALPDVRDGLKPVHRRILHAMKEGGYEFNKPFRKSARIVGDVMGKYHPHGDSSIYDAMVRMAQDFSMRLMLIDGQGNFGSMDGDKAAAMRYTEARLSRAAHSLIDDIDKETVDFQPNYDDSEHEPTVLPARYPNLLVNGAGGIAVGMATNIPPHNLGEVIDACCAFVDNPNVTLDELMELVPAPDFPTGGIILGRAGTRSAYTTGRGSVVMRARCTFEEIRKDRTAIVVTEIPYQVNKSRLIEQIAELVRDKKIEGISDLRDESDRDGVRVVIELKRDAVPDVVQAQLFRFSQLQTSFGVNSLALNGGRPQMMTLSEIIKAFVEFREEVITRRTVFLLGKTRERAHVLVGLALAVANLDDVIALIRNAPDPGTAREQLMARAWPADDVEVLIKLIDEPGRGIEDGKYTLSETQAKAILDLRLHRLTGLERDKLHRDEDPVRHPAPDHDRRVGIRSRYRRPDRPRGHGGDGDQHRLHQACAVERIPRPAPRRQRPLVDGGQGRGFRHRPVRGQHPHADDLLLVDRHRLQDEGLPPAARHAPIQGQGDDQSAAAGAGRNHLDRHAVAGGRGELEQPAHHVRHPVRRRAPQPAVRFHRHPRQRQDRHEAG